MIEPRLYLSASPTTPTSIPSIFRPDEVKQLLQNPPETRHSGFNLATYDVPRIDKGEMYTVSNGDRKRLDLYPDGTLVAYATFADFLGWPRDAVQFPEYPKINSLALIEFTFDFAQLYERILDFVDPTPPRVRFELGLRNAHLQNGRQLLLAPYGIRMLGFETGGRPAPDPTVDRSHEVDVSPESPYIPVGEVAYALVESLYNWFGYQSDAIPYSEGHAIDPEAIRQV
jgi:hypothetical protein